MAYSMKLPDGTLINDIPDELDPVAAKTKLIDSGLITSAGMYIPQNQDNPLVRGYKSVAASVGLGKDLAAENYDAATENLARQARYARENPGSAESIRLQEAWQKGEGITGGISEALKSVAKDTSKSGIAGLGRNVQAMGSGILAQIPNMVPPLAGMLGGAAAGSAVAPVLGTIGGGFAGAAAGNAIVGTSEAAMRQLEKAKINPEDSAAVRAFLQEHRGDILTETAVKGAVIGAVDTVTGGTAHFLLTGPGKAAAARAMATMGVDVADKVAVQTALKSPQLQAIVKADPIFAATNKTARNVGAAVLDPAGEFVGEYGGSLAATGEASAKDAFLEAISSLGQSGAMYAGQKAYANAVSPLIESKNEGLPSTPPPPTAGPQGLTQEQIDAEIARLDATPAAAPAGPAAAPAGPAAAPAGPAAAPAGPAAAPAAAIGQPFVDNNRVMAIADVNGTKVPFYLSTGTGGKASVPTGKWYPFFGYGHDGWINKGTEADINNFYGSPELAAAAENLNNTLGDIRHRRDDLTLPFAWDGKASIPDWIRDNSVIVNPNEGMTPIGYSDKGDAANKQFWDNISNVLNKVKPPPSGPFTTAAQSDQYISQQKQRGTNMLALTYQYPDGTFGPVTSDSPLYQEALNARSTVIPPSGTSTSVSVPPVGTTATPPAAPSERTGVVRTAPIPPATTTGEAVAPGALALPADLAGAKPRYAFGPNNFLLNFESDIDKAAYIASQPKKSKRDADYVSWLARNANMTGDQITAHGLAVRASIKQQTRSLKGGLPAAPTPLTIPQYAAPATTTAAARPKRLTPNQKKKAVLAAQYEGFEERRIARAAEPVDPIDEFFNSLNKDQLEQLAKMAGLKNNPLLRFRMEDKFSLAQLQAMLNGPTYSNPVNNKARAADLPAQESLLLMPCSAGKLTKANAAKDMYQGVMWTTLRAQQGTAKPNMVILSAKHGFISQDSRIEPYEQMLTPERKNELLANIDAQVAAVKATLPGPIRDVMIVGGADYREVMQAVVARLMADGAIAKTASVNETTGGIGEQRKQLGEYLRSMQPVQAAKPPVEKQRPSVARDALIAKVDAALANTPDFADYLKNPDQFKGKTRRGEDSAKGTPFITFTVGDKGKFTVRNSTKGLLEFKAKLNSAFTVPKGKLPASTGVAKGSTNPISAVSNMLEEGDLQAARDYMAATGIDENSLDDRTKKRIAQLESSPATYTRIDPAWDYSIYYGNRLASLTREGYVATVKGTTTDDSGAASIKITKDGKEVYTGSQIKFEYAVETAQNFIERNTEKPPAMARAGKTAANLDTGQVTSIIDAIKKRWENAPEIIVAENMDDPAIPQVVRDYEALQKAKGKPEGFIHRGKVYILADQMDTPATVVRTLFHESLGHFGLQGVFGKALSPILDQIVIARKAEVQAKATQYGLDMNDKAQARRAAEEVLAVMAQTNPELGFVKRAVSAIRSFLRRMGVNLDFTDNDIIRDFILPAREFVKTGKGAVAFEPTQIKSATGNIGTYDPTNPDIRYSLKSASKGETSYKALYKGELSILTFVRNKDNIITNIKILNSNNKIVYEAESESSLSDAEALQRLSDINLIKPVKSTESVKTAATVGKQIPTPEYQNNSPYSFVDNNNVEYYVGVNNDQGIAVKVPKNLHQYTNGEDRIIFRNGDNRRNVYSSNALPAFVPKELISPIAAHLNNRNINTEDTVNGIKMVVESPVKTKLSLRNDDTDITGAFDPENPDIRFSRREQVESLGINVNQDGENQYADKIVDGQKTLETRDSDSLRPYVGKRVAIVRTGDGPAKAIGAVTIGEPIRVSTQKQFDQYRDQTLVPKDSKFDIAPGGVKYLYPVKNPVRYATELDVGLGIVARKVIAPSLSRREQKNAQFSNDDTDITGAQIAFSRVTSVITDKLNETFNHPGKMSLWHKTVGSMYDLAQRNAPFKRVFSSTQNFINDVSYYSNEAANMAPRLLPRLETWKDLWKSPVSAQDNAAVSAPIFEGTLTWTRDEDGAAVRVEDQRKKYDSLDEEEKAQMLIDKGIVTREQLNRWKNSPLDIYSGAVANRFEANFLHPGVVFSDDELTSIFKLTPEQISLYREFRASADRSLDNMGRAEMLRLAGKDAPPADTIMETATLQEAAGNLHDYLLSMAQADDLREAALTKTASDVLVSAAKIEKLKAEGYAPLSRFGRYTVDVVVNGKREYFNLFESARASNQMAKKMRAEFGAANVSQGTMSQRQFEMFQGITPESLELFGNMLGLDSTGNQAQDEAFQTYIKLTKNNRSAMKRMIHRKGIEGYSEDAGRVLAAFIYSNARQTSAALHMGELGDALNAIPKDQGDIKDAAIELAKYVKQPQEEAQAMRGLLFAQYLGGSVASALVNFTQPFMVSMPYLSQYGGAGQIVRAMKDLSTGKTLEADLVAAMKDADEKGTLAPQGVHQLMAQARGSASLKAGDNTAAGNFLAAASNKFTKMALGWGKLFGLAEQINRRSTFIAAYRVAKEQSMPNPAEFATKAVDETQFISNKANKAKFGRGAVGGTLMTFKSYGINYLELLVRMATKGGPEGKRAALYMLAALMLGAGIEGLPFEADAEDLIDFVAQRLGYNFSSKQSKQEFLEDVFGDTLTGFITKGITGLPGAPLDVSSRFSTSNMIPGTGLLLNKKDHTKDVLEILGPAGDLAQRVFQGADMALSGDIGKAALHVAPKAIGNAAKGLDMAGTDMYKDAKGYKIIDTTPTEAFFKTIGFQPASVSRMQEANYMGQRAKDFYNLHAQDIRARWANGIFEHDSDQIQTSKDMLRTWNQNNPQQRITVDMADIMRRVQNMRKTKSQRIIETAPKAMRAQMRRDAAAARD